MTPHFGCLAPQGYHAHIYFNSTLETVDYDGDDGTSTPLLLAFDSAGDFYFLAACVYEGSYTKIFLVKDPNTGPTTLMREDLRETITGQAIKECGLLYLSSY